MNLKVTDKALKELRHIIQTQETPAKVYARVGVKGGGCSGFSYVFTLDETYNEQADQLLEFDDVKVVVDKRSVLYLEGVTIDFHDSLDKRGFKFDNPSVKTTCGCGSSFSL